MKNALVSVVLPTYNRAPMISASIQSVLKQSYKQLELVVINDCSSDGTYEKLENLAGLDNRIKMYHNRCRRGLPASRNKGVLLSEGSLIFFSEDDLILDPNCISKLVRSFRVLSNTNRLIGAVGPRLITIPQYSSKRKTPKEKYIVEISPMTGDVKCNFGLNTIKPVEVQTLHSCSLIPKDAILKIGGFETKLYRGSYVREETDFYLRLRRKSYTLFFEPRAIVEHHYGRVGGCIVNSRFSQEYYNVRNHLMYLVRFYKLSTFLMFPCFLFKKLLLR